MELLPGIGTDLIKFGISEEYACTRLGKPDKIFITEFGCRRLQFNSIQFELSFEPDNDNLLGWIEVHDPKLVLFGSKLVGMQQEDALELITHHLKEIPTVEDYDSFLSVTFERNWVELQIKFGRVENINLGVLYDDNDNPVWPVP